MEILAHRGYWKSFSEKNSLQALERAFDCGFGIETDVRDYCGRLVISHDIPNEECMDFDQILDYYKRKKKQETLAINIKADGLQTLLVHKLETYGIKNYFVFDMSVPEMVQYKEKGIRFFSRYSDVESSIVMESDAAGVWIDSFYIENWLTSDVIRHNIGKRGVGIISPEIHGFNEMAMWNMLKDCTFHKEKNLYLCTDRPMEAKEFFR